MIFRLDRAGKEFAGNWILRGVSVQCNESDRLGLIGRNGSGKSTLVLMIAGLLQPDEGKVHRSSSLEISRVEQIAEFLPGQRLQEEVLGVFSYLRSIEERLQELEHAIASTEGPVEHAVATEYDLLQTHATTLGESRQIGDGLLGPERSGTVLTRLPLITRIAL